MKEKAAEIPLYECGSFWSDAENTAFWKKPVLTGFQGTPGNRFRKRFWGVLRTASGTTFRDPDQPEKWFPGRYPEDLTFGDFRHPSRTRQNATFRELAGCLNSRKSPKVEVGRSTWN